MDAINAGWMRRYITSLLDDEDAMRDDAERSQIEDLYQASAFAMSPLTCDLDYLETTTPRTTFEEKKRNVIVPQRVQITHIVETKYRHVEVSDRQCFLDAFITPRAWMHFYMTKKDYTLQKLKGGVLSMENYHFAPLKNILFAVHTGKSIRGMQFPHSYFNPGTSDKKALDHAICLVIDRFTLMGSEGSSTFGDPFKYPSTAYDKNLLSSPFAAKLGKRQRQLLLGTHETEKEEEGCNNKNDDACWSFPTVPLDQCRSNPRDIANVEVDGLLRLHAAARQFSSAWLKKRISYLENSNCESATKDLPVSCSIDADTSAASSSSNAANFAFAQADTQQSAERRRHGSVPDDAPSEVSSASNDFTMHGSDDRMESAEDDDECSMKSVSSSEEEEEEEEAESKNRAPAESSARLVAQACTKIVDDETLTLLCKNSKSVLSVLKELDANIRTGRGLAPLRRRLKKSQEAVRRTEVIRAYFMG